MKNRSGIDFSKHTHRVEIFKCGNKEIRIDHLQNGDSRVEYVQFINTNEVCTVTGDFGNWVFCRPFYPSEKNSVSDHYWIEKLMISSIQKFDIDLEAVTEEIQNLINEGLEEYGYLGVKLEKAKEWYSELLSNTDDEIEYLAKAFRSDRPSFIDAEDVPLYKKRPAQLNVVFDAFDEICRRLKKKNNEK